MTSSFLGMVDAGVGELKIEAVQIDVSGDLAYRVGIYAFGRPAPDKGKLIEVYHR